MKKNNKEIVVDLIRKDKASSRKRLVEVSGLSLGTISNVVSELIEESVLIEDTSLQNNLLENPTGSGHRVIPLRINPDFEFVIGCEIRQKTIISVVVDSCRNKKTSLKFGEQELTGKNFQQRLEMVIKQTINSSPFPEKVKALGISLPGSVNFQKGVVVHSPRIENLKEYPLAQIMEEKFQLPTIVENSARSRGIAEMQFPPGENFKNVIYLHIGTGIGSSIIIDGRIFRGSNSMGGEFGHISINGGNNAIRCTCGNKGCLEILASCPAMVKRAKELINQEVKSSLSQNHLEFDHLVVAAKKGDKIPLIIFEEVSNYLAQGIGNILNIFNPELIIIGGEIVKAKEFFLEPLRNLVKTRAITEVTDNLRIEFSDLPDNAAALGVATMALEKITVY